MKTAPIEKLDQARRHLKRCWPYWAVAILTILLMNTFADSVRYQSRCQTLEEARHLALDREMELKQTIERLALERTLKHFQTREELGQVIASIRADTADLYLAEHDEGFDCDDFAEAMMRQARQRGYYLPWHLTTLEEGRLLHMGNVAYVTAEDAFYYIEPFIQEPEGAIFFFATRD